MEVYVYQCTTVNVVVPTPITQWLVQFEWHFSPFSVILKKVVFIYVLMIFRVIHQNLNMSSDREILKKLNPSKSLLNWTKINVYYNSHL